MELSGLHLLLTYQCPFECPHCFVWAGPKQTGVMTLEQIGAILAQAGELPGVEWIFFEGGEPFLYHPVLVAGARLAKQLGYEVGVVSNGYWATGAADAVTWLEPFGGALSMLNLSSDTYHGSETPDTRVDFARDAGRRLGLPVEEIHVATPQDGQESSLMYRGRAAEKLAPLAAGRPWEVFTRCPHEDLREPGRVHVDPQGLVQICQGIALGNLFEVPLREICARHRPEADPILGPLLEGGPAELVRRHGAAHNPHPADACHLCYEARRSLRPRFPDMLAPGVVYGEVEERTPPGV